MGNRSFEEILSMVTSACNRVFLDGDFNKKTVILECATQIYIAQMKGGAEGQYTGLTDKNGNKIFEGDIVTHFINWLGKRVNGVVKYDNKVASWVCDFAPEKESAFLADWVDGNGCEIIGNIHDNPELLKGGEQ